MKVSLLICTLPERHERLKHLKANLEKQALNYDVEIKIHDAGRQMPTGKKRNELIAMSCGEYFGFIDDDDQVSDDYIKQIVQGASLNPDVITFRGWMTTNGENRRQFTIKLGSDYTERNGHYYRYPNHLCYMRRDAIKAVRFPEIWNQEDFRFATEIRAKGLLKTEHHIDKEIYHYRFTTNKPAYGSR